MAAAALQMAYEPSPGRHALCASDWMRLSTVGPWLWSSSDGSITEDVDMDVTYYIIVDYTCMDVLILICSLRGNM